jgi:hypothetical protein
MSGGDRRGPYGDSHNALGQLWTPIVGGEAAVIELSVPPGTRDLVLLELTRVNYGFRGLGAMQDGNDGSAGHAECEVDIACQAGASWDAESRAVARITAQGVLYCSGTLLNNTASDFTPYFLTAAHCVTSHAEAAATVFYWNYQASRCGGARDGSMAQSQTGAVLLATSASSDFSLMRLLETPDPAVHPYYAGWDNRPTLWSDVTGIHHPGGYEKRISRYTGPTQISGYAPGVYATDPEQGAAINPVFLALPKWDLGTVEPGSSGSGLWNADHRLIGALSGNIWTCGQASIDGGGIWYSRFNMNWFQYPSPATSPAIWLDPGATGAAFVDGKDPTGPLPGPTPPSDAKSGSGGGTFAPGALSLLLAGALARCRRTHRRRL